MEEFAVTINGQSVLMEGSYKCTLAYDTNGHIKPDSCHATQAFLGFNQCVGSMFKAFSPTPLSYNSFLSGNCIWTWSNPGAACSKPDLSPLDIRIRFSGGASMHAYQAVLFASDIQDIAFTKDRQYQPIF